MKLSTPRKLTAVLIGTLFLCGCGQRTQDLSDAANAQDVQEESDDVLDLSVTDPEFNEIVSRFINEEVSGDAQLLDETQKQLIALVSLVTQQSESMLSGQVQEALDAGLTPVQIREAVYQCAPYTGIPRTMDAIRIMNEVLTANDIELPLEDQGTVDESSRFDEGLNAQATIFGDGMREIAEPGPENMTRSARYLVDNCFGDYYTRNGLDLETREMLTLAILVNLGTESQIGSHIAGNANMGRSREFIEEVIYQCLPYAGYPRMLNALNCLTATIPE